jgi:hypothetical protein
MPCTGERIARWAVSPISSHTARTMRLLIPPDWRVPGPITARLGDTVGRQRAMTADGHLLLVLHEPPVAGVPERTGRLFWRDPQGEWKSKGLGDGPQSLKRHVAEFAEQLEEFEKRWQTARTAEDYYLLLRTIAPLHRTLRNLHATLQQARELVPEDRDLINLRDQVGEIERGIELLHGDAKNGLDFTVARQAEQQAERTYDMAVSAYRLNLLAAVFFPVATLSTVYGAVFGMILAHGDQGWSTPALFWLLLGLGLMCGFVLARIIARKPVPVAEPVGKVKPKRR